MKRILKFSTPTCTYCKITSPQVNEYAEANGFEVLEINADSESNSNIHKQYTELYDVMSVPTIVITEELQPIKQATKLTGFGEIMSFIKG
jgi:thiol-disulfide isomerase/thioredoxin